MNARTTTSPGLVSVGFTIALIAFANAAIAGVCVIPDDDPPNTQSLPPTGPGCTDGYVSPDEFHLIVDGLPPDTEIVIDASHDKFLDIQRSPGGDLGGETEMFDSTLTLDIEGTGVLTGFERFIQIPVSAITEIGPRDVAADVQTFPNEMVQLQGAIFGDPDFDLLAVRAGRDFGLPSPGETTLTRLGPPGSDFAVDSFFDIHHEIDFQGAPGSVLEGFAGTTEGTVRMHAGQPAGPSNITFEQEGGDQPAFEITGQEFIPPGGGHIEVFHPTGQVKEQASEFDSYHLLISVFQPGPDPMELSIDKDVLNDTAVHWDDFHIHIMELGQTIAGQSIFIDASDSSADGIGFDNVMVMDDAVWFDGGPGAAPGEL